MELKEENLGSTDLVCKLLYEYVGEGVCTLPAGTSVTLHMEEALGGGLKMSDLGLVLRADHLVFPEDSDPKLGDSISFSLVPPPHIEYESRYVVYSPEDEELQRLNTIRFLDLFFSSEFEDHSVFLSNIKKLSITL